MKVGRDMAQEQGTVGKILLHATKDKHFRGPKGLTNDDKAFYPYFMEEVKTTYLSILQKAITNFFIT